MRTGIISAIFSAALFVAGIDAAPTIIDTVMVPASGLSFLGSSTDGSATVYHYSGRIVYYLHTGDNDSLSISVVFLPEGSSSAVNPATVQGDVGIKSVINAENGKRIVNFAVDFRETPPQGRCRGRGAGHHGRAR